MTWPRNPRIDRSKLYRTPEPTTATYQDRATIAGEDLTLADLRHLLRGTEDWPASSQISVSDGAGWTRHQSVSVVAKDTM